MSSVGGKMGPPFLGAYAAAKHGVEGFSEVCAGNCSTVHLPIQAGSGVPYAFANSFTASNSGELLRTSSACARSSAIRAAST